MISESEISGTESYNGNAWITDNVGGHYFLNRCISYLKADTVVIEIKSTELVKSDKIVIKKIKNNFYSNYVKGQNGDIVKVDSEKLTLKKEAEHPGDQLVGYLEIEVFDPKQARRCVFKGFFISKIENENN